jgi:protein Tex
MSQLSIAAVVAQELRAPVSFVNQAIRLLDDGATVPFIARYRKEQTGSMTDTQLRLLTERLTYLRELETRRDTIRHTVRELGVLTPELEQSLCTAKTKAELEDLYLPYRPKRRTKASMAEEAGLKPLADQILKDNHIDPAVLATDYIHVEKGIPDVKAALEGAGHILMERLSENAALMNEMRQYLWEHGVLKAVPGKSKSASPAQAQKYADYFDYAEPIKTIPSHRALALFRGRREQVIQFSLILPDQPFYGEIKLAEALGVHEKESARGLWLNDVARDTWKLKFSNKLESELLARLRELADDEAIHVFSRNLRHLLLSAPAGRQVTMGLDPGIRTGIKVAVIDATGKVLDDAVVCPFAPQNAWEDAISTLAKLAVKHHVHFVSIGNGTGSRDTTRLVKELMKRYPDIHLVPVLVNEAGASVYSASELASQELPDLDVTLRGAVSIARRLQDPLAELVKIEPKAIGIGQYQHDVNPSRLLQRLHDVVEDCVNLVGVDVNTASVSLLTYVSGLNETLAKNIVTYRDQHGPFQHRAQLKNVPRMGEKSYEQSAGFLRIFGGDDFLDASGVHPESYEVVHRILQKTGLSLQEVMHNSALLKSISPEAYVDEQYGLITVRDVLQELEKPGRDPRPEFKTPVFQEGVEEMSHLKLGMVLDGVVSNVTNFGAFVDVGVHQDGLVHISALADRFVKNPHDVVKNGDVVRVKVIEVDLPRRRIGLSMRLEEKPAEKKPVVEERRKEPSSPKVSAKNEVRRTPNKGSKSSRHFEKASPKREHVVKKEDNKPFNTAMADALAKLKVR